MSSRSVTLQQIKAAKEAASTEFSFLGAGSFRAVYDVGGGLVLKLPKVAAYGNDAPEHMDEDVQANITEAAAFKQWGWPFAPCVLIEYHGVPAVLMQKVNRNYQGECPSWGWHFDGRQLGTDDAGEFWAYDYGLDGDVARIVCAILGLDRWEDSGEYHAAYADAVTISRSAEAEL